MKVRKISRKYGWGERKKRCWKFCLQVWTKITCIRDRVILLRAGCFNLKAQFSMLSTYRTQNIQYPTTFCLTGPAVEVACAGMSLDSCKCTGLAGRVRHRWSISAKDYLTISRPSLIVDANGCYSHQYGAAWFFCILFHCQRLLARPLMSALPLHPWPECLLVGRDRRISSISNTRTFSACYLQSLQSTYKNLLFNFWKMQLRVRVALWKWKLSVKVGIVVEFEAKLLKSSILKVKVVKVQLDVFLMMSRVMGVIGGRTPVIVYTVVTLCWRYK